MSFFQINKFFSTYVNSAMHPKKSRTINLEFCIFKVKEKLILTDTNYELKKMNRFTNWPIQVMLEGGFSRSVSAWAF